MSFVRDLAEFSSARARPLLLFAAVFVAAIDPNVAGAQAAPYLKNAMPWQQSATGVSGLWDMQGYLSSSKLPPRGRVARTVDGQLPPMLPWAAELLEKRLVDAEHDMPFANTASLCLPQGVPYMIHAAVGGPLQILETPGQVTIISDAYNEMWFIHLNQEHPPREDLEPTYHGDSVGHWEGDTLVVDTVGVNTRTTLDQVGMPHSEEMHVVTRIRRTDPKTLEFLVTVDDPKTFSKPWSRRQIYKKAADDARIMEVVCNENQRSGADSEGHQLREFTGMAPTAEPAASAALKAELAPSGTLRAAINYNNPLLARRDATTGELSGIAVDLSRELARRAAVTVELIPYDAAGRISDAAKEGAWDIAFLAIDPARAADIDFTPAYLELEGTYLVPAGSPIKELADVDREGVRIAVTANSAYDLFLSRNLRHARLVRFQTTPLSVKMMIEQKLDAVAAVRTALVNESKHLPGSRILSGHFMTIPQAAGVPKGRSAAARYVSAFIEEMTASGFVADALKQHGLGPDDAIVAKSGSSR